MGSISSLILATGGATVADHTTNKRVYGMTIWAVLTSLVLGVGPLLGSFLAQFKGWHWTTAGRAVCARPQAMCRSCLAPSLLQQPCPGATLPLTSLYIPLVRPFALNFQEQIVFALGLCIGTFIVIPPFFAYLYYIQGPRYDVKLKPEERCLLPIDNQGPLNNFADRK